MTADPAALLRPPSSKVDAIRPGLLGPSKEVFSHRSEGSRV
jgi:hypothetical protein